MTTTRTPVWYGDGQPTRSWEEAAEAAGLTWDVEAGAAYFRTADGTLIEDGDSLTVYRTDTLEALGRAKHGYTPITNETLGMVVETALDGQDYRIANIAQLYNGRSIWVTVLLDEEIHIPGDPSPTQNIINFATNHDGNGGLRMGPGGVRVWCGNAIPLAARNMRNSSLYRTIRHTARAADAHAVAQELNTHMAFCRLIMSEYASYAEAFAMTKVDVGDFLDRWAPYSTDDTPRVTANTDRRRATFKRVLGSDTAAGEDTAWAVLQAVTEAEQHEFGAHSVDTRSLRALEGGGKWTAKANSVLWSMEPKLRERATQYALNTQQRHGLAV